MSILIYLLILAESSLFIILFLPFGVLAYAEAARREPWQAHRLIPGADQPGARMTRWHVVAASLVILSAIIIPIRSIVGLVSSGPLAITELPPVLDLSLIEVSLWLVTLSALFGPMYAVRLHSQGVHGAVLIGLGLCLFPANLLALRCWIWCPAQRMLSRLGSRALSYCPWVQSCQDAGSGHWHWHLHASPC